MYSVRVSCPEGFEVGDFLGFAKPILRESLGATSLRTGQAAVWMVMVVHEGANGVVSGG